MNLKLDLNPVKIKKKNRLTPKITIFGQLFPSKLFFFVYSNMTCRDIVTINLSRQETRFLEKNRIISKREKKM